MSRTIDIVGSQLVQHNSSTEAQTPFLSESLSTLSEVIEGTDVAKSSFVERALQLPTGHPNWSWLLFPMEILNRSAARFSPTTQASMPDKEHQQQ